ncbi:DsbA family protein [Actinokineospora sp. NPDC004072]
MTAARSGVSLNVILTAVVVVVAVLVVGGILLFNRSDSPEGGGVPAGVLNPPGSHTLTEAPEAKVTIVEFLDYQCPACQQYYTNITSKIEKDYAGRVTFVVRNFPLDMHPLAQPAARAAEAAAEQGKFAEMYHQLYSNYAQWALSADGQAVNDDAAAAGKLFRGYAERIGLDLAKFDADVASPAVQARIDEDVADGRAAGVSSTPSIFVNGRLFEPTGKTYGDVEAQLRELVDGELGE